MRSLYANPGSPESLSDALGVGDTMEHAFPALKVGCKQLLTGLSAGLETRLCLLAASSRRFRIQGDVSKEQNTRAAVPAARGARAATGCTNR